MSFPDTQQLWKGNNTLENCLLDPAEHGQQVEDVHIAHFTCSVQLEHAPCV